MTATLPERELPSFHLPDCNFCVVPPHHFPRDTTTKMSTAAVIGTSLPKIAPPSTPIHMVPVVPKLTVPSRSSTKIVDRTNIKANDIINRHKSAPASTSKTLLTSSDYGSHHYQYRENPSYHVYPPFVTESQTGVRIPPRVNPLQPPPPDKYGNSLETVDPHWHNEKRRNIMQQREWYRYHGTWSKAFYGSPAEKEAYRRKTRETLKQQMADYWANKRTAWDLSSKESEVSINYDRECLQQDAVDHMKKTAYLMQYRDANKSLMEQAWDKRRHQRKVNQDHESEILRYTPINWSHTLK